MSRECERRQSRNRDVGAALCATTAMTGGGSSDAPHDGLCGIAQRIVH